MRRISLICLVLLVGCDGASSSVAPQASSTAARSEASSTAAPGNGRLPTSTASNSVVQPQPPPGSCHARGSGLHSLPDPHCTPGAISPAVTQANIGSTICRSGYTKTVRPPEHITADEKKKSMAAYGDKLPATQYEYDHLVSLELGGATNDPRNLWPEPGHTPNPKDEVEGQLKRLVCAHRLSLSQAQLEIAHDWVTRRP